MRFYRLLLDVCLPKFEVCQGKVAPNCFKSHTNYVLKKKFYLMSTLTFVLSDVTLFLPDNLSGLKKNIIRLALVLKSSDTITRCGKTITKYLFSALNMTDFPVSLLLCKFMIQLSINLIENDFFFNISLFKWHTCEWNLWKSETIENFRNNKVKIKPTLYCSRMKLFKFEYNPLNVGLWYTNILKPLLVPVIKIYKKGKELLCTFSQVNLLFQCLEFNIISEDDQMNETKEISHQHVFCNIQVWIHQDIHYTKSAHRIIKMHLPK